METTKCKKSACALLSSLACPALAYLINGTIRKKTKVIEHKMCVLVSVEPLSDTFLTLIKIEQDIIKVHWASCKVPVFLDRFEWNLNFSTHFRKILKYMKIFPMGAELFHAHGQTDVTKLIVTFRSFANAAGTVTFTLARNIRWPEAPPSLSIRNLLSLLLLHFATDPWH